MTYQIITGDCRETIADLADNSVHTIVTSPPYWQQRDYDHPEQLGLEATPQAYVADLVDVLNTARTKLRADGTLWLNLGDAYAAHPGQRKPTDKAGIKQASNSGSLSVGSRSATDYKAKDMLGLPWLVAFALREAGWWLRSAVIWEKPDAMPESVTDRLVLDYEYVFLLSKSRHYYFDHYALQEPACMTPQNRATNGRGDKDSASAPHRQPAGMTMALMRNRRSVWSIPTARWPGAHYAVMPEKLVELCLQAGTSPSCCAQCGKPYKRIVNKVSKQRYELPIDHPNYRPNLYTRKRRANEYARGGAQAYTAIELLGWTQNCACQADSAPSLVLDPFAGAGTTLVVAQRLGRDSIGLELNPAYVAMMEQRLALTPIPLFGL